MILTNYQTWPATITTVTLINKRIKERCWEKLKTWLGIYQVGIFWVGIFREENPPGGV